MSVENVEAAFRRVDFVDFQEGIRAYGNYRLTLEAMAQHWGGGDGFPLDRTVAAFVSLSPANDYAGNLRSLATVMQGVAAGWATREITVTTFNACRARAIVYLRGERDFLTVTRGPKIRAFYRNIMDPLDPLPVTIDGHMVNLWLGRRMTMTEVANDRGWKYRVVADDFRTVARRHCLLPNQLQAMLWFTWKRIHDILAVHQLSLLRPQDQWGLRVRPEDVRPFERKINE